jgi:hypothetical protein
MNNLAGLLWFDNDPKKDWRQKVREAAQRYQQKTWLAANLCHINPGTVGLSLGLNDQKLIEVIDGIEVYASRDTQPNHFWITHQPRSDGQPTALPTPTTPTQMEQLRLL